MIFQFCKCENCIKGFMIFKLILSFIVWALSLAIISNINTILNSDKEYFYYSLEQLDIIKHEHVIKVILILSSNLLLNIFDFFVIVCEIFDSCCPNKTVRQSLGYTYPTYHREVYTNNNNTNNNNNNNNNINNNNNNNNDAIVYREVRVAITTVVYRKNEVNNQ